MKKKTTTKKKRKAAPKKAAPKKAAPKKAAPKKAAPKKAAPKKAAPKKAAPKKRGGGLGETLLRALTVAMVSDGEIAPAEEAILHRFAKEPVFRGVDASAVIERTIQQCLDQGSEATLGDVTRRLTTTQDREAAFTSCLAVAATDGKLTPSEIRMLRGLRDALEIPDARARSLAGPAAPIFD